MEPINWNTKKEHQVVNGLFGKFFHSETMTVVLWRFENGATLPAHDHIHEQITMVQEGQLELTISDKVVQLSSGDVVTIPPNVSHGGKALSPTIAIDIFHPVREDFKEKFI